MPRPFRNKEPGKRWKLEVIVDFRFRFVVAFLLTTAGYLIL
jgi:hypothetical protein